MLQIYLKSHDKLKFEKDSNKNLLEYEKGNLQECEIRNDIKKKKNTIILMLNQMSYPTRLNNKLMGFLLFKINKKVYNIFFYVRNSII